MSHQTRYDSKKYRMYTLGILTVGYVFNFVDRQILSILQEPIKAELGLSDSQLGLLTGFAFAIFYVLLGLPIAQWADRGVRRNIIALAVGVWSLMTGLSGLAQNYLHLLLARIGVAVGEAGGSPPSHSMISDIFPPRERATALATYSIGVNIGALVGLLLGGWINQFFGWRVALFAVAVPGLILALIIRLTVAEPARGDSQPSASTLDKEKLPGFADVLKRLWAKKTFRHLAIASGLTAFSSYSLVNWMPSYLIRSHDMSTGEIGTWLAILIGCGGGLGTFMGGYLADRLGRKDVRWYAWLPSICLILSAPLLAITFQAASRNVALISYALPAAVSSLYLGPVLAVTHGLVSNRMRAMASAILFLILNLIGLGIGPLSIGILSDALTPSYGNEALRQSLALVIPLTVAWAAFHFWQASKVIGSEFTMEENN